MKMKQDLVLLDTAAESVRFPVSNYGFSYYTNMLQEILATNLTRKIARSLDWDADSHCYQVKVSVGRVVNGTRVVLETEHAFRPQDGDNALEFVKLLKDELNILEARIIQATAMLSKLDTLPN